MGIYLGQLPPAELARLKAELAETIIANFCYPRFYDYRTNALRVRPVDRAKRQEVWLFLSSVDFTAWGRIDLLSPDFQRQIERLFIQFVQRNRAFFGNQGRKRMTDIRMLISASATAVTQGLRMHLSGQKQGTVPFGSPRPAVSWSAPLVTGKQELGWEQVAASTMLIQQQLQELRGEMPISPATDGRSASSTPRRGTASRPLTTGAESGSTSVGGPQQPAVKPAPAVPTGGRVSQTTSPLTEPAARTTPARPAATASPAPSVPGQNQPARPAAQVASGPQAQVTQMAVGNDAAQMVAPVVSEIAASTSNGVGNRAAQANMVVSTPPTFAAAAAPTTPATSTPSAPSVTTSPLTQERVVPAPSPAPVRGVTYAASPQATVSAPGVNGGVSSNRDSTLMRSGEDDLAMFEELRAQLIVWLRIEAIRAGLDISEQNPTQLLELLRQQGQLGETRLQVVSTLLNLANQVLKNGLVSVLDYKQAMMFHLMHTRYMNR